MFERGDKTNHGLPELNASSIGMAKAALESMSDFNLFGAKGGSFSIVHVQPDNIIKCQAVIESMLPKESLSKEVGASLLSIISFPAFAVENRSTISMTKEIIVSKLEGRYGLCRFLRDGHRTAVEDPTRLHYDMSELKIFENIECEWPMFFVYLMLDGIFSGNFNQATDYLNKLKNIAVVDGEGFYMIPELYFVPSERVKGEYKEPMSQIRTHSSRIPHLWSQSLFILANLLFEVGILTPADIDPLNRRLLKRVIPEFVTQSRNSLFYTCLFS
ncbi:hypothetical protein MXB_1809 [Myxobolus squamalis]|nr:hypothetical protein MXB_1809 [Myxobolus squamalis]